MSKININNEFEKYWNIIIKEKEISDNESDRIKQLLKDAFKEGFMNGASLNHDDIITIEDEK